MAKTNASFLSGAPELLILRLLSHREMYGYELVNAIRTVSNSEISLAEGVIYPLLHNLEAKGFLRSKDKVVAGRKRLYYAVTSKGQKRLDLLVSEWQRVSSGVNAFLGELNV